MSIILAQIGWAAYKLEGGYKAYRRDVLEKLEELPQRLSFRVICGPTGSGKSRLLAALADRGQQTLDLEMLAQHRGSVLGRLPGQAQPSQKRFGSIPLPAGLVAAMHAGECLLLEVPLEVRVAGLLEDYRHFIENPKTLIEHLQALHRFHGSKQLEHWTSLIHAGDFATFVSELLTLHYDPGYFRATSKHYANLDKARRIPLNDLSQMKEIAANPPVT